MSAWVWLMCIWATYSMLLVAITVCIIATLRGSRWVMEYHRRPPQLSCADSTGAIRDTAVVATNVVPAAINVWSPDTAVVPSGDCLVHIRRAGLYRIQAGDNRRPLFINTRAVFITNINTGAGGFYKLLHLQCGDVLDTAAHGECCVITYIF